MPSFKETANAKFKSLRKKLERRGRKAERVFKIIGLSGILSVSSLATQEANAQTRDGNQPITELRMTSDGKLIPVRSSSSTITYQQAAAQYGNQQTGTQQRGQQTRTSQSRVRTQQTGPQTAQEIYSKLPQYTRDLIDDNEYQIIPELQGGRATGLNRPAAGVVYSCAVKDPYNPNSVLFLPGAEAMYPAGGTDLKQLHPLPLSWDEARNAKLTHTGPYAVQGTYTQTYENKLRDERAELERREQGVYQGNKRARIEAEEATSGLRHTRIKVEQAQQEVNKAVNVAQNIGYTLRKIKNTVRGNY